MKITVKTPKPRNPHALAARQKKAGSHEGSEPQKRMRRELKQQLQRMLSGLKSGEE